MTCTIVAEETDPAGPLVAPESSALDRIRIVLVETSHPGNIGAAARAIKVMGLSHLALVSPRYADARTAADALALASGAVDVLEHAIVHATLDEALADTMHAIAMSARDREFAPPLLALRDAAREAVDLVSHASDGVVAFVFGSERYGLSNHDVLRCQARCRIETSDIYSSLNLAQAVQLVAYECRLAALASEKSPNTPTRTPGSSASLASHDEREALIDHLERGLIAIGYLDPEAPKKLMPRLRRLFARAKLESEEVGWLRGIAKAMLRATKSRP